jgi:deoxyribonucleoside regulator
MCDDLHAEEERELETRFGLTEAIVAGHGADVGARPVGPRCSQASGGRRRPC